MFDPTQLELTALPSVAFEARRDLPSCQGIYFAILPDGTVLYIGKAKNIFARWRQHHRADKLSRWPGVSLSWLQFDGSSALLDELERACIECFSPVLNGERPIGRVADDENVRCVIRMPGWVFNIIAEHAEADRRSVPNQIIVLLEEIARQWGAGQER